MERQNNSEKNKTGRFILSDFNAGKAPVIKDNMVLAGQNRRESRSTATQTQSTEFGQGVKGCPCTIK